MDTLDIGTLTNELIAYKVARGYGNVFVSAGRIVPILERCTLRMPPDDAADPQRLNDAATQLLKAYLDRWVRLKEREAEAGHVRPGWLKAEEHVQAEYRVRARKGPLLADLETLLQKGIPDVDDAAGPLPRFHVEWHLFNPLLREGNPKWKESVTVRPPALGKNEARLVRDVKQFWAANHGALPYSDCRVYLLRNLPKTGIGLFHRSGFYPDFILWIRRGSDGATRIRFLDPHGLHHGGLEGNRDRFEALKKLEHLSELNDFKKKHVLIDGFILADTPLAQIPDAGTMSWSDLEKYYPLLHQDTGYEKRLFAFD